MFTASKSLHILTVVTAAALISGAIAAIAAESSCIPPPSQREPADGDWKGTFRLSYQMTYGGSPPIKIKWTGDLDLSLKSEPEGADFVPWLQRFCGRVPLGGNPMPGCDKQGNPVGEPEVARVERPGRTHVLGRAYLAVGFDFATVSPKGESLKVSAPTEKPAELRPQAEWAGEAPNEQIARISLMGSPSQFNYLTSAVGEVWADKGKKERITETGKASGTGAVSEKFTTSKGTQHFEHAGSQQGGGEQQMARLNLLTRDCWLMKGTVDEEKIRQSVEGTGMRIEFLESSWEATLQQRDLQYEHDVERFVAEPVPATLSWDYVDRVTAEYKRLVGEKPSEYRACVAKPLLTKMMQIQERVMQNLIESFPRVKDGATAPVLCAAAERIFGVLREFELQGIQECPLAARALQMMWGEWEALQATHPRGPAATCSRWGSGH